MMLLKKTRSFFQEAGEFAAARSRHLVFEYDFVYGEAGCILLDTWYWFVLVVDPSYLASSARLSLLLAWAPSWQWQTMFLLVSLYKLFMVLFASWSSLDTGGKIVHNPLMRTRRQTQALYCARWVGLLCSWFFYVMLGYLLSGHGVGWGTGTFGLLCLLCFVSLIKVGTMLSNSLQISIQKRGLRKAT